MKLNKTTKTAIEITEKELKEIIQIYILNNHQELKGQKMSCIPDYSYDSSDRDFKGYFIEFTE